MEKFIIADGCALRIGDTQKGDSAIVLLHGYFESLNVWDELSGLMQSHARIIAPDLPGHGISEVKGPVHTMEFLAEVVHAALISSGVSRCTLVGHSMGGYVALAFAAAHPEMLDGLVLLSSTPNPDSPVKREDRLREIDIIESGKKELLARTLSGKGFAPQNRRRFADEIEDAAEQIMLTEEAGAVALLRGMMQRPDMNDTLRALKVPQMFIFGRHDEYIPSDVAESVAAAHPQARVVWLDASGHNALLEQPRETAAAILEFINLKI